MPANKKLLMLPGDGIGPEVMNQVKRVIGWMDKTRHVSFDIDEDLVGGVAYDAHGTSQSVNSSHHADGALAGIYRLGRAAAGKSAHRHRRPRPYPRRAGRRHRVERRRGGKIFHRCLKHG